MSHYEMLKEMFAEMVVKKNASLHSKYYHPDFILQANGKSMTLEEMQALHVTLYETPIQYHVGFDDETIVEDAQSVAGRFFITVSHPDTKEKTLELILIARFKEGKIERIWELTFPDWSEDNKFKQALKSL